MTFKQRIWLLPIMVAAIVSIGIAVNARITSSAANALKHVGEVQYPLVEAMRLLRADHAAIQEQLQQAVSEGDAGVIDKAAERINAIHSTLSQIESLGGDERILANKLIGKFDAYLASATHASLLMLGKGTGDSGAAIKTMQQDNAALESLLSESNEKAIGDFKTLLADSRGSVQNTLVVSIVSALVTMVVLGIGSWILIGSVFQSLGGEPETAVQVVRRIATGDFTQEVQLRRGDSASLLYDIVRLQEKLGTLIRDIHHSSSDVDNAAHEMNSSVTQLSDRTSAQAASLEETASSMEEMTATVKQNADNARQANDLAVVTRKQAEAGGDIVHKAITAMAEINTSSKRIADIISVIDEIAFQTNLLALNAAVEAARAGEQGRGFAVVATEVRNLAQRSATAAREIKSLINESVSKVQDGSELVNTSGERLTEIVTSVKKVADIISDISAASQEQARGLEQVNATVTQLDHVTQQNSAMVQQASTVSDNVALQARRLLEIVSQFKVEESAQAPAASPTLMSGNAAVAADWQQVA